MKFHLSFFCSKIWTGLIYYLEKSGYMSKSFNKTIEYIIPKVATLLYMLSDEIKSKTSEIRIRVNQPLCITCLDKSYFLSKDGSIHTIVPSNPFILDNNMIEECFMLICNNSVYAYENEISDGYITLSNGARVGLFGEAIFNLGKITAYKNITSLNYRIPREIIGSANQLKEILNF